MKKISKIILKVMIGILVFLILGVVSIPILFRDKIKVKVEQVINESLNARVSFEDYSLNFFHNFPNLSFSLNDVKVIGVNRFESDTLATVKDFNLVFNLKSLFKGSGYEVKYISADQLYVNTIILADGTANYDIMKESDTEEAVETEVSDDEMKILLRKVDITNSTVIYTDLESDMKAVIDGIDFTMSGDMTLNETDLLMAMKAEELTFVMEGMKYLNRVEVDFKMDLHADLVNYIFTMKDNYLSLNDMALTFAGVVEMPAEDIGTDLTFKTEKTDFKSLLSLVPAVYMSDYQDLVASGNFMAEGKIKGIYSDADSTIPDVTLALTVNNGGISYPDLPDKIENINIKTDMFVDGTVLDRTLLDISKFHFELAGSPFDMTFNLKTPVSDPDFIGSLKGRIDLGALMKAMPLDSIDLAGAIDMSVEMAGRLSMIEEERYGDFKAEGTMTAENMLIAMTGFPEVRINSARFVFTPAWSEMADLRMNVGGNSDFLLAGRLENYIQYMFDDGILKGNLSMESEFIDVYGLMAALGTDTTEVADTTAMTLITVPGNIDFDFNAFVGKLNYDNIKAENVKGHIILRNSILSIRDAGMKILSGTVTMSADYDTRDTLKPSMKAEMSMSDMSVKDAFTTFVTVQKLAPAAKGIDGDVSFKLTFNSLIGNDMMPLTETINGYGKIESDQLQIIDSPTFTKFTEVLNIGERYSNTFKDINISFNIKDGRVYTSPFDVKMGNAKMNISGDQGLDQTLNYIIKTEIPRSDLGAGVNNLVNNLTAQASSLGISYKPADIMKFNVKVSGTFTDPRVAPLLSGTTDSPVSSVVEGAKEAVKQVVEEKVEDVKARVSAEAEQQAAVIMKEAEEKAQMLRDEAVKAAEALRGEADLQAENLIKAAEPKGAIAKIAAQRSADALKKEADQKAERLTEEADTKAATLLKEAEEKKQALLNEL